MAGHEFGGLVRQLEVEPAPCLTMNDEDRCEREPAVESLSARFAHEFGVNEATAVEMLAWLEAEQGSAPVTGEAVGRLQAKVKAGLAALLEYQELQTKPKELRMSTAALAFLMGFHQTAGAGDLTKLGRRFGVGKQTINKCIARLVEPMQLPPLETARDEAARARMAAARRKQLKTA
jgi:hypothetical protein